MRPKQKLQSPLLPYGGSGGTAPVAGSSASAPAAGGSVTRPVGNGAGRKRLTTSKKQSSRKRARTGGPSTAVHVASGNIDTDAGDDGSNGGEQGAAAAPPSFGTAPRRKTSDSAPCLPCNRSVMPLS